MWSVQQRGGGTLAVANDNSLSGNFIVNGGALDLSHCSSSGLFSVYLESASLFHTPQKPSVLSFKSLSMDPLSHIKMNGYSQLVVEKLECTGVLNILLEDDGFESGKETATITSKEPIAANLKINTPEGYSSRLDNYSINVSKK
ncbi:hypothetical protein [Gallaecimonas sp. GXIMD1310]|uniref:hypothetical protein n=1 Tax=Gallaecimonas sp. GXIMD1310 TaxID=3131926 RepID=UPI003252920D